MLNTGSGPTPPAGPKRTDSKPTLAIVYSRPKTISPNGIEAGDVVEVLTYHGGFKDRGVYNDVPKGSRGVVTELRSITLDKKNPDAKRYHAIVAFEVQIDTNYKKRFAHWQRWFPSGYVRVTLGVNCDELKRVANVK